ACRARTRRRSRRRARRRASASLPQPRPRDSRVCLNFSPPARSLHGEDTASSGRGEWARPLLTYAADFHLLARNAPMRHIRISLVLLVAVSSATLAQKPPGTTAATTPATTTSAPASQPAGLKDGHFLAICGDSITEQKLYSLYIEDYLLMCRPRQNVRAMQFGWGGEVVGGFLGRMSNVLRFPVTAATTCYGMNDGGYGPVVPERVQKYRDGTKAIVDTFKKSGVRFIVVGSPGAVDTKYFHVNTTPDIYNATLAQLRDVARQVA